MMNTHDIERAVRKYRRISGDLRAIAKGRFGERVIRRFVLRHAHRLAHRVAWALLKVMERKDPWK